MNDLFLKACLGEPVERTPVWMMRQAGRYLEEYRELRSKYDFWTLCRTPELAAKVTLQPIDRLSVDAAILFSDILVGLPAMGLDVVFNSGPKIGNPVRTREDIPRLKRTTRRQRRTTACSIKAVSPLSEDTRSTGTTSCADASLPRSCATSR